MKRKGNPAPDRDRARTCTLREVEELFGLSPVAIRRIRKRLAARRLAYRPGSGGWTYRLADVEQAIRDDRAAHGRQDLLSAAGEPEDPCPVCGAPVPRRWLFDRCLACLHVPGHRRAA